jgi:hypothetical protein
MSSIWPVAIARMSIRSPNSELLKMITSRATSGGRRPSCLRISF